HDALPISAVGEGMEQAIQFLRSMQDRARGGLARSERFDAAQVVRSCVALERPLARKRGIALQGVIAVSGVFLHGDPNALYQVLTNLIRNAVAASRRHVRAQSPDSPTTHRPRAALSAATWPEGRGAQLRAVAEAACRTCSAPARASGRWPWM